MIYWTDWGLYPKIERATFSGHSRQILVNTDLAWPNGLTLDPRSKKMFWCDGALQKLEVSAMDGSKRQVIISDNSILGQPFGLSFHEGSVYWTDWKTKVISRKNLTNNDITVVTDGNSFFTGLALMESEKVGGSENPSDEPCKSSPCLHGGTCVSGNSGYSCQCASVYTGHRCEIKHVEYPENHCTNHSCLNGATCLSGNLRYICRCPSGFVGPRCDQVDHCGNVTCLNNGTCTHRDNGFECLCLPRFIGPMCERVAHCYNVTCLNNGSCTNRDTNFECLCSAGFMGRTCEQVDHCHDLTCSNNGSCRSSESGFECQCSAGFMGSTCDTPGPSPVSTRNFLWSVLGIAGGLAVLLAVALVIIPCYLWRNRNLIMMKIVYYWQRYDSSDRPYHVFISYSDTNEADEKFVTEKLLPMLQGEMCLRTQSRLQHGEPGEPIANVILSMITKSSRTILVVSPDYCRDDWPSFEIQVAQREMMQLRHRIVPILLGDPDMKEAPPDLLLSYILKSADTLTWPRSRDYSMEAESQPARDSERDEASEARFWTRLRLQMPKVKRNNMRNSQISTSSV